MRFFRGRSDKSIRFIRNKKINRQKGKNKLVDIYPKVGTITQSHNVHMSEVRTIQLEVLVGGIGLSKQAETQCQA